MNIRVHSQQKTPQPSTAAPLTNPFQSRPFAVQAQAEQSSPQQQEISEQEQQQKVKRCGYNFANVSVSDRSKAIPETPIIQQQFVRNEQTIVDTSQQKHPLVQRLQAKSMQHERALEVGKVSPLGSYVRQNFHVQPKLAIGQPGDKYEQEADKVAEQVISMPEIAAGRTPVQRQGKEEESLQKQSLVGSITPLVQRQEEEDIHEVQANQSLENRLAAQKGGGSPLSKEVRSFMEPRFGTDFSGVRVHTNSEAIQMNRELHSQAFTHGRDLYFGDGKYNPSSSDGKRLLAHELTHVVQQTGGVQRKQQKGTTGPVTATPPTQKQTKIIDGSAASVSWIDPASRAGSGRLGVPDPVPPATITESFITGSSGFRFSNYLHGYLTTNDSVTIASFGLHNNSGIYTSPSQFGLASQRYPVRRNQRTITRNGVQGIEFEQLVGARTVSPEVAGQTVGAGVGVGAGALGGAKLGAAVGSIFGLPGTIVGGVGGALVGGVTGYFTGKTTANTLFNFPPIWTNIQLRLMADGTRDCQLLRHSLFPSNSFYSNLVHTSTYNADKKAQEIAWENNGWGSGNPWGIKRPTHF